MSRAKGKLAAIRALEGRCARLEAENAMLREWRRLADERLAEMLERAGSGLGNLLKARHTVARQVEQAEGLAAEALGLSEEELTDLGDIGNK